MTDRPLAARGRTRKRHVVERPSTETTILDAARRCFEKTGFRATTVEGIAVEARISRATLYRYFSNKDAIVDRISQLETEKVNAEMRKVLTGGGSLQETILESLFLSARIAHGNSSVRALVENTHTASRTADPSSPQHATYRATWGNLIDKGFKAELFAPDLTPDGVAHWLLLSLSMLLVKIDAVETSDEDLRQFIKRFILTPLFTKPKK